MKQTVQPNLLIEPSLDLNSKLTFSLQIAYSTLESKVDALHVTQPNHAFTILMLNDGDLHPSIPLIPKICNSPGLYPQLLPTLDRVNKPG